MEIGDKEVIGFGAALFGWLGGVWTVAAKVTKWKESVESNVERIDSTIVDHSTKIAEQGIELAKQRIDHQKDMENVRAFFQTTAGGQKFMTFPDHDLICLRNNKEVLAEIRHLAEATQGANEQLSEIGKQVTQITVDIAVMKAGGKK